MTLLPISVCILLISLSTASNVIQSTVGFQVQTRDIRTYNLGTQLGQP
jgi:hypothetical protein